MSLEELQERRQNINKASQNTLSNMEIITNETRRVQEVAHNARAIFENLEYEFEKQTKLNRVDQAFLFVAIGLQCLRIFLVNKLTEIEKAGQGNKKEGILHDLQDRILGKFDDGTADSPKPYYAPLNQIITGRGVPYDATRFQGKKDDIFKGANHRFSTLAHDPVVGLVIGTSNILTNTITVVKTIPVIISKHVVYDENIKNPQIGSNASTVFALKSAFSRLNGDSKSVVAALIKQIIHIGTDLYTPCGIQLPFANLILDKKTVEKVTKYVSSGDIIKLGISNTIAEFIDFIIAATHRLCFNENKCESEDLYKIRTKKIIRYSYVVATGSNVLLNAIRILGGDTLSLKNMDFAGLIRLIKYISEDRDFQIKIKEEFILGHFNKLIEGKDLKL